MKIVFNSLDTAKVEKEDAEHIGNAGLKVEDLLDLIRAGKIIGASIKFLSMGDMFVKSGEASDDKYVGFRFEGIVHEGFAQELLKLKSKNSVDVTKKSQNDE